MAGNNDVTKRRSGGRALTMVCVADGESVSALRAVLAPSGMRIGSMRVRDGSDVLKTLETQLARHGDDIDALVLSQVTIERATGKRDALLRECVRLAGTGVPSDTLTVVIDETHAINQKGITALRNVGITVTHDTGECADAVAGALGLDVTRDGTRRDGAQADGGDRMLTEKDVALGGWHGDPVPNDPFASLRDGSADDGPDGDANDDFDDPFDDDDDGEPYASDGGYEDIDPFADVRNGADPFAPAAVRAGDGGAGASDAPADDDSAHGEGRDADGDADGYDDLPVEVDEAHRYDGKSGDGARDDVESMIAPTYGNPTWDYSEINEGIREQHGGGLLGKLGGGRRGGRIIGETDDRMTYANSRYIEDRTRLNGGYDPPSDCKIITCYSNVGGSGKTTVSTMIGAQLVWDFDRDLLQRRSSNMAYRVLVLSLNEFDDIEVKGIGNASGEDVLASNEGRDVLALKQKIAECNGDPTWDDIAHCFKASPTNYVMYLPSMTLREKFETRQEIDDQDYKGIINVCRRFFNFIIIDTPDVMYNNRYGLVTDALSIADVLCLIMTPDSKSTHHMYDFIDGMKAGTPNGTIPFARDQTLLVVNKVATPGNPYVGHTNNAQIPFKDIANTFTKLFYKVIPIPMTDQNMSENIMFGYDRKVKEAASDITDTILEMIDRNDHANGF